MKGFTLAIHAALVCALQVHAHSYDTTVSVSERDVAREEIVATIRKREALLEYLGGFPYLTGRMEPRPADSVKPGSPKQQQNPKGGNVPSTQVPLSPKQLPGSGSKEDPSKQAPLKTPGFAPAAKNETGLSHMDRVIHFLTENKHIKWEAMLDGHMAIVPADKHELALKHVKEKYNLTAHTHGKDHKPEQPLRIEIDVNLNGAGGTKGGPNKPSKEQGGAPKQPGPKDSSTRPPTPQAQAQRRDSAGFVSGYDVNWYHCWNSGSKASVAQVQSFAKKACKVLVEVAGKNKDKGAYVYWNSPHIPNVGGKDSFIRYGTKVDSGNDRGFATTQVCEGVMEKFNTVCQNGPGANTQGGELKVGEVRFGADPTEIGWGQ